MIRFREEVVIGGSGASLRDVDPRRVPRTAPIIRVNNFFVEPTYQLGRRVDCAYFSADPRAVRFYVATLRRLVARGEYDVRASASHSRRVSRLDPPPPFEHYVPRDPALKHLITTATQRRTPPTSGVMAMAFAYEHGARRLLLAGIDFYVGDKYAYPIGPRLAAVLEPNMDAEGYDHRLHSYAIDRQVVELLMDRGVAMLSTAAEPAREPVLAGAGLPERSTERSIPARAHGFGAAPVLPSHEQLVITGRPRAATTDWVGRAGPYPLGALLAARVVRRLLPRPPLRPTTLPT